MSKRPVRDDMVVDPTGLLFRLLDLSPMSTEHIGERVSNGKAGMPIQRQPVCDERNNQMSLPQLGQVRCERQPLTSAGFFLKKGYEIFRRH
jgi:hypothetical protein